MATEITKLLATAGVDPRDFALVAYGGAGPTHANLLAEEAQLTAVMVPIAPGTFCALGAVLADIRRDYVRTARHLIGGGTDGWPAIAAVLAEVEAEARRWIAAESELIGAAEIVVSFDMRYQAQAYELPIIVPAQQREALDAASLAELFHAEHERLYGFRESGVAVQTATVRVGVIGRVPPVVLPEIGPTPSAPHTQRAVWHGGMQIMTAVHARAEIGRDVTIAGPAIVEQADTTTFILPGWCATADRLGTLHITRKPAA
jgi:N-methylhydantoinase A